MKILVCAKVCNGALNPFDESALECALRLSDDITVISMGPQSTKEILESLTRLGAKAVLISDKYMPGRTRWQHLISLRRQSKNMNTI